MEENQDAKKIRLQRPAPLLIVALGELQHRRQSASPELAGSTKSSQSVHLCSTFVSLSRHISTVVPSSNKGFLLYSVQALFSNLREASQSFA
jgi:hypothetical protein